MSLSLQQMQSSRWLEVGGDDPPSLTARIPEAAVGVASPQPPDFVVADTSLAAQAPVPLRTEIKARGKCHSMSSWLVAVAGVAVVISGLAVIAAIAKVLYGRSASNESLVVVVQFVLKVEFAMFDLAGYRVALMCYNGSIPGPTLTAPPGSTVSLTLINGLPANRATPNVTGWPCWKPPVSWSPPPGATHSSGPSHLLPSEFAASPREYVNTPHAFRTTNLHTHGLQVSL